jgi:D-alanyl-D-alanine carboxypeptidase
MRNSSFAAAAGALWGVFALVGCAGSGVQPDVNRDAALTRAIEEGMRKAQIPGALVGIWEEGKVPFVRAFGVRDKDTQEPMSLNINVRIGSVTKTFVTQAMLQLVERGLLGLDDPISMHVANVPNGENITLRQLAGMRSGLYSYTNIVLPDWPNSRYRQWQPRELADVGLARDPVFAPGADFDYSNTNTILIGLAIERVTGKALPAVLDELIIKPLNLKRTFLPAEDTFPEPHSKGYGAFPNDETIYETSSWNGSWGWAAGSMISSFQDIRVWTETFGKGSMLRSQTLA